MWPRENDFDSLISAAAAKYGIPVWIIKATIAKESSFEPTKLRREPDGRASRGLMQLLEGTARWMGYTGPAGDDSTRTGGLYNVADNVNFGVKYLAYQRKRYPGAPWDEIYAAYNAGSIRKTAGTLVNEKHVVGWRTAADHFKPGWRELGPFVPAPPAAPSSQGPEQQHSPAPAVNTGCHK